MSQSMIQKYKLMVLYLVKYARKTLTNTQIMEFFPRHHYADYFRVQEVIGELIDNGQLIAVENAHQTRYFLTKEGEDVMDEFDEKLSVAIRRDMDAYLDKVFQNEWAKR